MDYINIGPTPHDENCAQVGQEDYHIRGRKECAAYCRQLRRMYPEGKLKEANFEAFLLIEPLLLEELHQAIQIPEGKIHFKALCPIFRNEKDLKAAKGVERFVNRLKDKGVNEQVDEFRRSTVKSRFLFWK